jgi:hypothetical protein
VTFWRWYFRCAVVLMATFAVLLDRCLLTLINGRELLATVSYARIRRLVIEACSSLETA